jgi:hypothetical protein
MSKQIRGQYSVSFEGLAVTDNSQFLQLLGASGACAEILEVRIWQTSDNTLAGNAIHMERGTGGAGGTSQAIDEWIIDAPTAVLTANRDAPTTEVTGVDMNIRIGWNILQELVWLPTPEMQLWLKQSDDLAFSLVTADSLTIGYTVTWNEYDA